MLRLRHRFLLSATALALSIVGPSCSPSKNSSHQDFSSSPKISPVPQPSPKVAPSPPPSLSRKDLEELEERKRKDRWNRSVVATFGVNRAPAPPLEPSPQRRAGRPERAISRPENPQVELDHLSQCIKNYSREWFGDRTSGYGGTLGVLGKLRSVNPAHPTRPECWSEKQNKEVLQLEQLINEDMDDLRNLVSREQHVRKNTEPDQLKNYNKEILTILTRLGRHYQEVQEDISYCRLFDIVQNDATALPEEVSPEVTSEDKALLHVVGDIFGKSSGLEGQTLNESTVLLEKRRAVIQTLLNQLEKRSYIASSRQAEPCQGILGGYHPGDEDHGPPFPDLTRETLEEIATHIDSALPLMQALHLSLPAFHEQFILQLAQLKKNGDWFYFMAGSLNHAVIYLIQKEAQSSYQFRIYNSGDGLGFHASVLDGSNNLVHPFFEKRGVSAESLSRFTLLKSLRDLAIQPQNPPNNSKITYAYENISQELGGTLSTPQVRLEDFLDPQISGTCSYYILPYMEASRIGDQAIAANLEYFVKSRIIDLYFKINENRLQKVDHARRLATHSLNFYTEELAKNLSVDPGRKGRYLDWGMARETATRVDYYRRILDTALGSAIQTRESSAPRPSIVSIDHIGENNLPGSNAAAYPIQHETQNPTALKRLSVEHWVPSSNRLNQDLAGFLQALAPTHHSTESGRSAETQQALAGVHEIVRRIPLKSHILPHNPADLETLLGHLNDLSQLHLWALVRSRLSAFGQYLGIPAAALLTQAKLLTLADQAIRAYANHPDAPRGFSPFPSLYNPLFEALLIDRDVDQWISLLTVKDSSWAESFQDMATYWHREKSEGRNNQRIFQWELLPLYHRHSEGYRREIYKNTQDMASSHWSQPFGNPTNVRWGDLRWAQQYGLAHGLTDMKAVIQSLDFETKLLPLAFFEVRDISFITHYILTGSFSTDVLQTTGIARQIERAIEWSSWNDPNSHKTGRVSRPISFSLEQEPPRPLRPDPHWRPWNHYKNSYRIFSGLNGLGNLLDSPVHRLVKVYENAYTGDPNLGLEISEERKQLGPWSKVLEQRNQFYSVSDTKIQVPIPYYRRLTSGDIVSQPQMSHQVPLKNDPSRTKEVAITTLEMQRQLLKLGSPLMTLAYFREHPGYLRERRWQTLFKALIFQPELLRKEYSRTPTLPRLLSDFTWLNYQSRLREDDFLTASFFLRMHQILEEFTAEAGHSSSWPADRVAQQGFRAIMARLPLGVSDTRNIVLRDFLRTYRYKSFIGIQTPTPDWQAISEFIKATLYRNMNALEDAAANFEADEENAVFGLYQLKRSNLIAAIDHLRQHQEQNLNLLLNDVVHHFRPKEPHLNWTASSAHSAPEIWQGRLPTDPKHVVTLDLTHPLIYADGHEERPLPGFISNQPLFREMIHWSPAEPYVTWLGDQKYELIEKNGTPVRIDAHPRNAYLRNSGATPSLTIEKKWGNFWYQLLSDSFVNQESTGRNAAWVLMPGYKNWQLVRSRNDQSLPATAAYLKQGNLDREKWAQWDQLDPQSSSSNEILSFDPDDGKLFSVSRYSDESFFSSGRSIVQKVKYEKGQAFVYGTTLFYSPSKESRSDVLNTLARIEQPRFIWTWKDHQGNLEKIELPRFNIHFKAGDARHPDLLVSPELENYALSQTQVIPAESERLGDYPHFIVLEKDRKIRIAVPRFNFEPLPTPSLHVSYEVDWNSRAPEEILRRPQDIYAYGRGSQHLFVWSVDPFNHHLKLPEAEDRFFLSLIHLWGHSAEYPSYDRARDLLYGSRSDLGDFRSAPSSQVKSGARQILEWIFSLKNQDHDPRAIALRLGASLVIIENDFSNHRYSLVESKGSSIRTSEFFAENREALLELYQEYLKVRERISTRWLPEDLERLFLTTYLAFTEESQLQSRLKARWAELSGETVHQPLLNSGDAIEAVPVPNQNWSHVRSFKDGISPGYWSEWSSCSQRHENLFLGILPPFEQLYPISLQMDEPSVVRQALIAALSQLLGIQKEKLNPLTHARLKEEYLSFLRLLIGHKRSPTGSPFPVGCIRMAEFLYALAQAPGDRSGIRQLTLNAQGEMNVSRLMDELRYPNLRGDEPNYQQVWNAYFQRENHVQDLLDRIGLKQVNWQFLPKTNQSAKWRGQSPSARPSRHWDPRTESIPQNFQYRYDRKARTEDAQYDLYEIPVIAPTEIAPPISKTAHPQPKAIRRTIADSLVERDLNEQERKHVTQVAQDLEAIFSETPVESSFDPKHENFDPFIRKKLQETRKLIHDKMEDDLGETTAPGGEQAPPFKKVYEWVHPEDLRHTGLRNYRPKLEQLAQKTLNETKVLEAKLTKDLQALPDQTWDRVREYLFQESSVEIRPTLRHVLQAYASGVFQKVFILNPGLTAERATALLQDITSYLIRATYYFRVQETLRSLDQLLDHPNPEEMQKFYQTATALRGYKISEHPDYLVFEYMMRILIRSDQIRNLEMLTGNQTTLLEMIMGSGKTSVLLPLASHQNAVSGQRLSMVVLPESLVPSMTKQLNSQLEEVFGQGVDRMTIQRKDKYDLPKLQYLYGKLRKDLETQRVLVTSNSSIQSLFLIFVEALSDFQDLNAAEEKIRVQEIAVLQDIFLLFRNYAYVLIDEVDSILDIMASHRFSLGHRTRLEPSIINATVGLYRLLSEDHTIRAAVKIPFLEEGASSGVPFSKEAYDTLIKNRLIGLVSNKDSAPYFFDHPEEINSFRQLDMEALKKYFSADRLEDTQAYIKGLPHPALKDVISVLYTQIHQALPMTLNKSYLVHYGLCPEDLQLPAGALDVTAPSSCHPFIGIPYHSGSPVVTSRFGTDLESLNYTIQAHLEHRNVFAMFKLDIERLRKLFREAQSAEQRNRIAAKISNYFDGPLSHGQILNMTDAQVRERAPAVSKKPALVLNLVKIYAAPKIEIFPNQLFTNSYIYPILFKKIQGMTGTLWNYESFPAFYDQKIPADSLARTLTALWKTPSTHAVQVIDPPPVGQDIARTLDTMLMGRGPVSLIDQGGFFRGKENQSVVNAILAGSPVRNPSYASHGRPQLIFYDSEHQIQITRDDGGRHSTKPYSVHEANRNETGAFWDMQHTTGSDLKVHPQTVALLTLNKYSIMRDLLQSAWRLRELEQSQSAVLMMTRDDIQCISKLLVEVFGKSQAIPENAVTVPLEKILLYLATNEAIKVGEVNYRSVKAHQRAVIVDQVFDTLVDRNLFTNETTKVKVILAFNDVKPFFSNPRGQHPHERYGVPVVRTGTVDFLRREIRRILAPIVRVFKDISGLEKEFDKALNDRVKLLRRKVVTPLVQEVEAQEEMEIETEQEHETEQEQEQEQEIERSDVDSDYQKAPVSWDRAQFFTGGLIDEPTMAANLPTTRMEPQQIAALSPVMPLQDILIRGGFNRFSDLFDSKLAGSLNLFPVFQSKDMKHDRVFTPFGAHQQDIDHVLVVLHHDLSIHRLVMLTKCESLPESEGPACRNLGTPGKWLQEDVTSEKSEVKDRYFLIYQFGNGFIRMSGNFKQEYGKDENTLNSAYERVDTAPEFASLLVQIKFLSGRISYTESERAILTTWTQSAGRITDFYDLFHNFILEFKATTREAFQDSTLHDVLIQSPDSKEGKNP